MNFVRRMLDAIFKAKHIIIILGIMGVFVLYLLDEDHLKSKERQGAHNNRRYTEETLVKNSKLLLDYHFLKNITQYPYVGSWDNLSFKNNQFDNKNGDTTIYFTPIPLTHNGSFLSSIEGNESLKIIFFLRDGEYIDNMFKGNLSLILPPKFNENLRESIQSNSLREVKLINKNITFSLYYGEYYDEFTNDTYNETDIEITFIPNEKVMSSGIEYAFSNLFSLIKVHINNTAHNFRVDFSGSMYNTDGYSLRVLNYSIILTIIGCIQIYYSAKFLIAIDENNQVGLNTDLMTISMQILWDSIICSSHFFLALTHDEECYEFATPSIVYFCLFSIFQLKILFMAWRSRYNSLMMQDLALFRRKLLKFYSLFYIGLFICLLSLRFWYHNFIFLYMIFLSTWIFQIIHSARTGTKPPMSLGYILWFTFSKLYIPIYIKGYPSNIFSFSPSYGRIGCIIITLVIQVIVLTIQKVIGPRAILPQNLRTKSFNYYRSISQIDDTQLECIICLCKLDEVPNTVTVDSSSNYSGKPEDKLIKHDYYTQFTTLIEKFKSKRLKKEYMMTPCNHSFHTFCMEQWMEMKNECPYCRSKIPPLEY